MIQNHILFSSFLENKNIHNLAEAWWKRLFTRLFADFRFHRFYTNRYVNGEKGYDGNPIFDAYFPGRHKLVRIIQELPEDDAPHLSAYLDSWPIAEMNDDAKPTPTDPAKFDQPIPELVLVLTLTPETAEQAQLWLRNWIVEDLGVEEMERVLEGRSGELNGN